MFSADQKKSSHLQRHKPEKIGDSSHWEQMIYEGWTQSFCFLDFFLFFCLWPDSANESKLHRLHQAKYGAACLSWFIPLFVFVLNNRPPCPLRLWTVTELDVLFDIVGLQQLFTCEPHVLHPGHVTQRPVVTAAARFLHLHQLFSFLSYIIKRRGAAAAQTRSSGL